jgi:hypothetical protein
MASLDVHFEKMVENSKSFARSGNVRAQWDNECPGYLTRVPFVARQVSTSESRLIGIC